MFFFGNAHKSGIESGAARSIQLDAAFDSDSAFLLWLAEVIAGDSQVAEESLVNARKISQQHSGLFVDWLTQWARSATIQQAIQRVHTQISLASRKYDQIRCPTADMFLFLWRSFENFNRFRPRRSPPS